MRLRRSKPPSSPVFSRAGRAATRSGCGRPPALPAKKPTRLPSVCWSSCRTRLRDINVQIFGTDIDEDSIQHARRGVYAQNISLDVSAERLNRFFIMKDGEYQISRRIRDMVVFSKHNLLKDAPFSRIDLVSCRNLLIYLRPPAQKRALRVFHYALNQPGFLLLGLSESVGDSPDLFSLVDRKNKIYRRSLCSSHDRAGCELQCAGTGQIAGAAIAEGTGLEPPGTGRSQGARVLRTARRDHQRAAGYPGVSRSHGTLSRSGARRRRVSTFSGSPGAISASSSSKSSIRRLLSRCARAPKPHTRKKESGARSGWMRSHPGSRKQDALPSGVVSQAAAPHGGSTRFTGR